MNDKEKLRQELLEKTLGKNAKNRRISSFANDLEETLNYQQEVINDLSKQVDENTLREINEEMQKDFGISYFHNNQDLTNLQNIKEALTLEYHYNQTIDDIITFIKKSIIIEKKEYSLLLYNCKEIKDLIKDITSKLYDYHYIQFNQLSYLSFEDYTVKQEVFYQDMYNCLFSDSNIIIFDYIEQLPLNFISMMISLLSKKEMNLENRYIEIDGVLKETHNQLTKNVISSIKWQNKYIIFLSHVSYLELSNKLGLPFIKSIDECKEFHDIAKDDLNKIYSQKFMIFKEKINKQLNLSLSDQLLTYLHNETIDDIDELFENIFKKLFDISETSKEHIDVIYENHLLYIQNGDVKELLFDNVNTDFKEIDEQLHSLIGLKEVKEHLVDLKQYYQVIQKRKAQGKKTSDISKHMIFTGNPGTGKTTVARILAQYLKASGILSSGHLIEVSRKDLVGQYVGHTAVLTDKVISSALGGVLFIDEAYSLYRGANDSFGLEAIDTLVKAMEDKRDEFVVVLAGYSKEMEQFLQANSGLRSRFSNIIEFKDYNGEELYKIACLIAKSQDYVIDENCKEQLIEYLEKKNRLEGGNGRLARNTVEKAMVQNAKRDEDDILKAEDFQLKGSDNC